MDTYDDGQTLARVAWRVCVASLVEAGIQNPAGYGPGQPALA